MQVRYPTGINFTKSLKFNVFPKQETLNSDFLKLVHS